MNILFEIADKDLIIIGLVIVGLLILGAVIFFVINRNNKKEYIEALKSFEEDEDEEEIEKPKELTEEQKKAKAELERVYAMMSEDLEKQEQIVEEKEEIEINEIDAFEREQEENAIISYQELIRQAEAKKRKTNIIADEEEKLNKRYHYNEYNNYDEDEIIKESEETAKKELYEDLEEHEKEQLSFDTYKEEPKKFKNSEIISPIFGVQSEGKHVQRQNIKQKKEEQKSFNKDENNEDFLNSLKEFRNKL